MRRIRLLAHRKRINVLHYLLERQRHRIFLLCPRRTVLRRQGNQLGRLWGSAGWAVRVPVDLRDPCMQYLSSLPLEWCLRLCKITSMMGLHNIS